MRSRVKFWLGLVLIFAVAGCQGGSPSKRAKSAFSESVLTVPAAPLKLQSITVAPLNPSLFMAKGYNFFQWTNFNAENFKTMLTESLATNIVFDDSASETVTLHAELKKWENLSPSQFPPSTYEVEVIYKLSTLKDEPILEYSVSGSGTSSTFMGSTRVVETNNLAFFANTTVFLDQLRANLPAKWAKVMAKRAHKEEILAALSPENASYRVTNANVTAKDLPADEGEAVDTFPMGSVVHVIGALPSGWLQVARDGKPFGWIHQDDLMSESGGTAAGPKLGAKPTIYIAYPKGGEQVAEDTVEFIGYVSSQNRTDRLEVMVNNRRYKLSGLWSEFRVDPEGLRGYPIRWRVPISQGRNKININVLDQEGFLVNMAVEVEGIRIVEVETASNVPQMEGLPARLDDVMVGRQSADVTAENFMNVLGDWVKDTAKSDYNKGNTMFDQGRFARAAYYYRKAVKTEPIPVAYFNLGLAEKSLGKDAEAAQSFSEACRLKVEQACTL